MASQQTSLPPSPWYTHQQQQQQQQQQFQEPQKSHNVSAIVFGSLVLIFSAAYISAEVARYVITGTTLFGPGIWFIIWWLLTGTLGVLSGTKKTNPYIIAVLVFTIIMLILICVAGYVLSLDVTFNGFTPDESVMYQTNMTDEPVMYQSIWSGSRYFLAINVLGFLMFIAALGSSITACVALCNCCPQQTVQYVDRNVPMVVSAGKPAAAIYSQEELYFNNYANSMSQPPPEKGQIARPWPYSPIDGGLQVYTSSGPTSPQPRAAPTDPPPYNTYE